jgi:hypothetical protein
LASSPFLCVLSRTLTSTPLSLLSRDTSAREDYLSREDFPSARLFYVVFSFILEYHLLFLSRIARFLGDMVYYVSWVFMVNCLRVSDAMFMVICLLWWYEILFYSFTSVYYAIDRPGVVSFVMSC